jgi:uncharacterized repeat protein (TIGR03803 family)
MYTGANFKLYACLALMSLLVAGASVPARGQSSPFGPFSESTIYTFTGGADGDSPTTTGALIADSKGALYGTTQGGGASNAGVVFKLTPPGLGRTQWSETVLYSFSGPDGSSPSSGLVRDSSGALYGVTWGGGANDIGVAYKLTPPVSAFTQWNYVKLYDFATSTGGRPVGEPQFDGAGALIGAAEGGGVYGIGTIYKLTPPTASGTQWTGVALYNFPGCDMGGGPHETLSVDTSGVIYGSIRYGGAHCMGSVFKLTPPGADCTPNYQNLWCKTDLYSFTGADDGGRPNSGLTRDESSGVFYGTASSGGYWRNGVIFSLTPPTPPSTQWVQRVLYSFGGGQDGGFPVSPVTLMGGALYGVTDGGYRSCGAECGAVFQLLPPAAPKTGWTKNTLFHFTGGAIGANPAGRLIFNSLNFGFGSAIYGVTWSGGASDRGVVFTLQCAKPAREVFGGALHVACAL